MVKVSIEESFLYTNLGDDIYNRVNKIPNAIDLIIEAMKDYKKHNTPKQ